MKYWEYIAINCEVCGADISIYDARGKIMPPWEHKNRRSCNNPACQNTLRHPPAKKLEEKPCKNCGEPIPTIWPNSDPKKKSQYDKLQFCGTGCKQAAMFKESQYKEPERDDSIMNMFIFAGAG